MARLDSRTDLTPVDDAGVVPVYYDEDRGTYHARCEPGADEPIGTALIEVVSAADDAAPDSLAVLYESVDPDALDALFAGRRSGGSRAGDGRVSFTFSGCAVTVRADGEIVVAPDG